MLEAGKENQFFHSQKDRTEHVLNDRTKRIDRHEVASVEGNLKRLFTIRA
ncbi:MULTISPECIES: hypothetical protein [Brucella]|jgi:type VI secretion system secreted protein VgrG|nr:MULTISPECIES: hypothetical protein [Brucella/Ochrobactrum group]MBA8862303.1 type VI secretion system secreted protein VgrG [Brucella anthropi]MDG9793153.1 hypothetical protein [Brucella anthropi]MDH0582984.1 hypothetical protein [Brucella anthropi]MDH0819600.1 hypothetical protein [Brucella anthropi]MDH2086242.1 hypothetical protein [Brucella anthropi]